MLEHPVKRGARAIWAVVCVGWALGCQPEAAQAPEPSSTRAEAVTRAAPPPSGSWAAVAGLSWGREIGRAHV